jgi:hypothetical protein
MYSNLLHEGSINVSFLDTYKSVFDVSNLQLNYNFTLSNDFLLNNTNFINNLASTVLFKNNPEQAYKFFPQMQETFTDLEILFDEVKDESTLDYMRTIPDGKLYYPEPFIASPSFLHEEI